MALPADITGLLIPDRIADHLGALEFAVLINLDAGGRAPCGTTCGLTIAESKRLPWHLHRGRTAAMLRYLIVILLWAMLYLPWLGHSELKGEEGRRILPARAMMQSGDYIVPSSEGKPYHRKPPLINWLVAGSFHLHGGESLWAARLPVALSVLGLALVALRTGTAWLAMGSNNVARHFPLLLAAIVLTSGGFLEKGRLAEIDGLYAALFGMGFLCWAAAWQRGREGWSLWVPAAVFLGVGILAKGPIYLPFYYGIVILTLQQAGELRRLRSLPHLVSLAVMFAIPMPWVLASRARMATLDVSAPQGQAQGSVWWQQLSDRMAPAKWDAVSWAMSPLETFVSFCPVVLLVLVLWFRLRRGVVADSALRQRALFRGLAWGVLAGALGFALIPEPHARFQVPLVTPLALLLVMLVAVERHDPDRVPNSWLIISNCLLCLLPLLSIVAFGLPFFPGYTAMQPLYFYASTACLIAWLLLLYARSRPFPLRGVLELLTILWVAMQVHISIGRLQRATEDDTGPPARKILAAAGPDARIMAFYAGPQHFLYYLGPYTREAATITALTDDVTHIVTTVKKWSDAATRQKFQSRGFTVELVRVFDREGKEYIAVGKAPPAVTPQTPVPQPPAAPAS